MDKLQQDLKNYNIAEYKKSLCLDKLNPILGKYLKGRLDQQWSTMNRITGHAQLMKHTYLISKKSSIVTCFKVTWKGVTCICGYLYSRNTPESVSNPNNPNTSGLNPDPNTTSPNTTSPNTTSPNTTSPNTAGLNNKPIVHQYVCTGPTFKSQDGEWRGRMIIWDQFNAIFEKYSAVFEPIEQMVIERMNASELSFQTDFYFPEGGSQHRLLLEDSVNCLRLPIKYFILCWVYDFYNIHYGIAPNHINLEYKHVFYQSENVSLFDKAILLAGGDKDYTDIMAAIAYCKHINSVRRAMYPLQCGQKLVPLTALEASQIGDINFSIWREIYISTITSNLVLNFISPSFSIINNWYYIQHAHNGMFDNKTMHAKYEQSGIADKMSIRLVEINKANYVDNNFDKGPINSKFFEMSENIKDSISYADNNIKLTDLVIGLTSEYVGRTLRDIPKMAVMDVIMLNILGKIFSCDGIFTKHMFEYVYAIYCMNTKIGAIHGDLHLNNVTIHRLYNFADSTTGKIYITDPRIAYIIGPAAYIFPHIGSFSTIIDFSRAIIGDRARLERDFSVDFVNQYDEYQHGRILHILHHYFPALMKKYESEIRNLLVENFPLVFKIFSAIDSYVLMSNIKLMIELEEAFTSGKLPLAPCAIKLLTRIADQAEKFITANMQKAALGSIKSVDEIPWPNHQIIQDCFSDYLFTGVRGKNDKPTAGADCKITDNVIDIFNYNNDITSEIEEIDTWGPLLSLDKYIELHKKYNIDTAHCAEWFAHKSNDEMPGIQELVAKYVNPNDEKYESWMFD